jgi:hypothetical protein
MEDCAMTKKADLREQLLERFWDAADELGVFSNGDAGNLAVEWVDTVIAGLRRDPRWAAIPRAELELVLGDARRQLEQDLAAELEGYAPADELLERAADAAQELLAERARALADEFEPAD